MTEQSILSPELLRKILRYEDGKLFWLTRMPDMFTDGRHSATHICASWNTRYAGTEALISVGRHGYRCGCVFGRRYLAHRVIFTLVHGGWPDNQIDHINQDQTDNHIKNLRAVSHQENMRNQKLRDTNTSGHVGVQWNKPRQKWQAQIMVNGKSIHLGLFIKKIDAIAARAVANIEYGFHPNHGSPSS